MLRAHMPTCKASDSEGLRRNRGGGHLRHPWIGTGWRPFWAAYLGECLRVCVCRVPLSKGQVSVTFIRVEPGGRRFKFAPRFCGSHAEAGA
jgi:hypothetical protein